MSLYQILKSTWKYIFIIHYIKRLTEKKLHMAYNMAFLINKSFGCRYRDFLLFIHKTKGGLYWINVSGTRFFYTLCKKLYSHLYLHVTSKKKSHSIQNTKQQLYDIFSQTWLWYCDRRELLFDDTYTFLRKNVILIIYLLYTCIDITNIYLYICYIYLLYVHLLYTHFFHWYMFITLR